MIMKIEEGSTEEDQGHGMTAVVAWWVQWTAAAPGARWGDTCKSLHNGYKSPPLPPAQWLQFTNARPPRLRRLSAQTVVECKA